MSLNSIPGNSQLTPQGWIADPVELDHVYIDRATRALVDAGGNRMVEKLNASGYDQTSQIQQLVADSLASGAIPELGVGEFILNGPVNLYCTKVSDEGYGYGMNFRGVSPERTRILDVRADKSAPLIRITQPAGVSNGARMEMSLIEGFTLQAASPAGVPFAMADTPVGVGIFAGAVSGSGYGAYVYHSNLMRRVRFMGHAFPLTLDDCTQFMGQELRFSRAEVAVRLGGNVDLARFLHCGWGSETSGNFNLGMVGIQDNYNFGVLPPGGENIVVVDNAWVMTLGAFYVGKGSNSTNRKITNSYFESTKRYFYADHSANTVERLEMDNCHFSLMTNNDPAVSTDPTNPAYGAHIQFGSTGMAQSGNGPIPHLTLRNCYGAGTHANAVVSFNARGGYIDWDNSTVIESSGGFGHLRNTKTNYEGYRRIRTTSLNTPIKAKFGGTETGLSKLSGDEIPFAFTAVAGANNVHHLNGDQQTITLPDADCTVQITPYSAAPPTCALSRGEEMELHFVVPAAVTGTRTLSFGSLIVGVASLTYSAADVNKFATLKLRAGSNNNRMTALNTPVFAAAG